MNRKKLIYPSLDNRLEKFKSPFRPPTNVLPIPPDFYFPGTGRVAKKFNRLLKNQKPQITLITNITKRPSKTLTCPHCGKHIDIKISLKKG